MLTWFRRLDLRWQLLAVALPLAVVPMAAVGAVVGYVSTERAYRELTRNSADDLERTAQFTLDLLHAHYRQFEVYKQDKKATLERDLATLATFAHNLVEAQDKQASGGRVNLATAQAQARAALKAVNLGASGYIYAMTTRGDLKAHIASEGENIYDAQDEDGRYFIREMCAAARDARPGEVLYIVYPWRNAVLGDPHPRYKMVAYRYFAPWDWIVAAGSYLDETYEDHAFERAAFEALKDRIKAKKVGTTGYIYALTADGTLTIHPFHEGENIWDEQDHEGRFFIREICRNKRGWIRYPWKNRDELWPRTKIVRYDHFEPWDWVVGVGSYEEEFYLEPNRMRAGILQTVLVSTLGVGLACLGLVFWTSSVLTSPVRRLVAAIQRVRRGRLDERVPVELGGELGKLAEAFNEMADGLDRTRHLEESLAQQGRLASLGVLASGVAHEINNPLGVILGYAGHLESKLDPGAPGHRYAAQIKRECNRCRKIVQDLLGFARLPRPEREVTVLNPLLEQIADVAANHTELQGIAIRRALDPDLPPVRVDPGQIRQVALNLLLNAGAALEGHGTLIVATRRGPEGWVEIRFEDDGPGIPPEDLDKVFEPFFTTKAQGTGLGLAISKQLVEQHRGRIRIESEPGRGTCVTVALPAAGNGEV
ncbi:MAG: cache domain-containing protein [Thermodesulfobacteriota bacterium]